MGIADGDIVKVVARMQDINGSDIINTYYYIASGVLALTDADFLTAVESELSTAYALMEDQMPSTVTPVDIKADKVSFVSGKVVQGDPVGTIPWTTWSGGQGAADGLPQGCAAVVDFTVTSAGVQGRKYMGPLTEATQSNGVLVGTCLADLAAFAAEVLDGFTAGGGQLTSIVMSTKYAAAIGLASAVVKAVVGYQRRRKSGVGA